MISTRDRLILACSLCFLFGAGGAGGYLLGRRCPGKGASDASPAGNRMAADISPASPAEWWTRALERLGTDLNLTNEQKRTIQPLLQEAGGRMFGSRDRALFQIHLELLQCHEKMAETPGLLDPAQETRLGDLRTRLRKRIESQFPQFLKDTPLSSLPATAGNSSSDSSGSRSLQTGPLPSGLRLFP